MAVPKMPPGLQRARLATRKSNAVVSAMEAEKVKVKMEQLIAGLDLAMSATESQGLREHLGSLKAQAEAIRDSAQRVIEAAKQDRAIVELEEREILVPFRRRTDEQGR